MTGYYQQPEVVQFTETPHDAVVCEGCRFELSCSILRQSSSAGEQYVPLPELEWIFNGTTINDVSFHTALSEIIMCVMCLKEMITNVYYTSAHFPTVNEQMNNWF